MAIKLIDGTKEAACRKAEADAIRAKTGGTAPLTFDFANGKGFADAIAAIQSGGSLPTSITKLDGGSFTPSSNLNAETHRISHNLGELPKYCIVWTDELSDSTPVDANYAFTYGMLHIGSYYVSSTSETYAMVSVNGRTTGGGNNVANNTGTQAQLANFASNTYFSMRKSGYYYKAGVKYNWLAWI